MYIQRHLESVVTHMNAVFPAILIIGPRQVGKTTMLKKLADDNRRYVTLDHASMRELAKEDPAGFIKKFTPPILIDEIQYAPELLPYIKIYIDTHQSKGDFWLTGSQTFHMMKNVGESLAGRIGILNMYSLSQAEIAGKDHVFYDTTFESLSKKTAIPTDVNQLFAAICKGAMPALHETPQPSEWYYDAYVQTYLERDIRDLAQVGNQQAFLKFMRICAARTAQMVNYSEMAKAVGVTVATAKHWLSMLIASGIVYLVEPYANNVLKRMVKSPKLYFLDTGLCAFLAKWTNPDALELSAMAGAFMETYVVSELIKNFVNGGRRPNLYYYRDTDKREIDIILEENHTLYPIEIKKSASPNKSAIKHFSVLEKTHLTIGEGNVICLIDQLAPIDAHNTFVPIGML